MLLSDRRLSRRITVVTLHAAEHLLDLDLKERAAVVAALSNASRVLVHCIRRSEAAQEPRPRGERHDISPRRAAARRGAVDQSLD